MASPAASEEPEPSAAATAVFRYARSELMPTDAMPIPDEAMPATMRFACLGVAYAMRVLMQQFAQPGHVPEVFDERQGFYPLCGPNAPHGIISFVWTEHHTRMMPRLHIVHDFVLLVVSRLQLTLKELVLGYGIVEKLIVSRPTCAQAHCLRPIFLIACEIAAKVTNDVPHTIGHCYDSLSDVFTATSVSTMKVMERKLLFMLQFRLPTGAIHQRCALSTTHPPPTLPQPLHADARPTHRTPRRADADAFYQAALYAAGLKAPMVAMVAPKALSDIRHPPLPQHIKQRLQQRQRRRRAATRLQAGARGMAARRVARTARDARLPTLPTPRKQHDEHHAELVAACKSKGVELV